MCPGLLRLTISELNGRLAVHRSDVLVLCPSNFSLSLLVDGGALASGGRGANANANAKSDGTRLFRVDVSDLHINHTFRLLHAPQRRSQMPPLELVGPAYSQSRPLAQPDAATGGGEELVTQRTETLFSSPAFWRIRYPQQVLEAFAELSEVISAVSVFIAVVICTLVLLLLFVAHILIRQLAHVYSLERVRISTRGGGAVLRTLRHVYYVRRARPKEEDESLARRGGRLCCSLVLICLYAIVRLLYCLVFNFSVVFTLLLLLNEHNLQRITTALDSRAPFSFSFSHSTTSSSSAASASGSSRPRLFSGEAAVRDLLRRRDYELSRQLRFVQHEQSACNAHLEHLKAFAVQRMDAISEAHLRAIYRLHAVAVDEPNPFAYANVNANLSLSRPAGDWDPLADLLRDGPSWRALLERLFVNRFEPFRTEFERYFAHYTDSVLFHALGNRLAPFRKLLHQLYYGEWLAFARLLSNASAPPDGPKRDSPLLSELLSQQTERVRAELERLRFRPEQVEFARLLNLSEADALNFIPIQIYSRFVDSVHSIPRYTVYPVLNSSELFY